MNSYSEEEKNEIFDSIIEDIEVNNKSLTQSAKGLINLNTFYRWVDDDKDKAKRYACACEARQESMFEDIIEISDDFNEDPQRSRLKIDARKWALSKMNPKKYGDKIDHTSKGEKIETTIIKWGNDEVSV